MALSRPSIVLVAALCWTILSVVATTTTARLSVDPPCCDTAQRPTTHCPLPIICCADGNWQCQEKKGKEGNNMPCCSMGTVCCCDPQTRPNGRDGRPMCIEGSTCCSDGYWSCNEGDGSATCEYQGEICNGGAKNLVPSIVTQ